MEEKKSSLKIEFVDFSGNKHIFYNEQTPGNEQLEFIGGNLAKFLKSLGFTDENITDVIDAIEDKMDTE